MWLRRLLRPRRLLVLMVVVTALAVAGLGTRHLLRQALSTPSSAAAAAPTPPPGGGLAVPDTGGAP